MPTVTYSQPGIYRHVILRPDGSVSHKQETSVAQWTAKDTKPVRSRERKAPGWLYPKGYSRAHSVTSIPQGMIDTLYPSKWRETFSGSLQLLGGFGVQVPEWRYTLVQEAEIEALLAVKDSKVNAGVAWAEARKTGDMIADRILQLARAMRAARKGDFPGAVRALGLRRRNSTASNWAELQYGWLPLCQDIYGGAEALAKSTLPPLWLITGKGNATDNYKSNTLKGTGMLRRLEETEGMRGCYVRLDYLPGNDFFVALKSLGLGNPAEIAWELLPYSFVVDWVWPVGDWLSSLDAATGLVFLSGSRTERAETVGRLTSDPRQSEQPDRKILQAQFTASARDFWLNRYPYDESPIPLPPPPKNPFRAKRVANALSLLALASGRRP